MQKVRESRPGQTERDWRAEAQRLQSAITDDRLMALANATGVPTAAWALLAPGWASADDLRSMRANGAGWNDDPPDGAYVFAEHSGDGQISGISLRAVDGRKGSPSGAKRGLIVPANLPELTDPVLVVEGASDVASCGALGLAAVGRPSNRAGAEDLAMMLDGRAVLVVGERDAKPDGAWPGRDGAKAVAQHMAARWCEPVRWTLPPPDAKDVREWLRARLANGLNASDANAMRAAGAELLSALEAAARATKPERRTQADALVDLAREHYRLGVSTDGEAFAVATDGPAVAMMFRGGGSGLRAALAKEYRRVTGRTPSASALADALVVLQGMAQDSVPEPLALRVAMADGGIVLDLADINGQAAVVRPAGWTVEPVSPVLFRRTALTAPLPEPIPAEPAALADLRKLLNVDDDTWPLVVGWLVAALLPDIPHPVLMLGGEQGTGKSTAARLLVLLVDPSAAPLRCEPHDAEQWAVAASGSWLVALDNVSHVSHWLSDTLCRTVTGEGVVRRRLYADRDLDVLAFRRCVIITSIDAGALRGDLGDRLLLADLERIPEDRRRTETELIADFAAMRPRVLGALLSAAAGTLKALPEVALRRMPRMADFARVLAALDAACPELTGGRALDRFSGQRRRIAGEVVESDAVAAAVVRLMESRENWSGTATELLEALTPQQPPKGWPANARGLAGRLRRLRPALLEVGIRHNQPRETDKTRTHRVEKVIPKPPEPPETGEADVRQDSSKGLSAAGIGDRTAQPRDDRQSRNGDTDEVADGSGGMGGDCALISAGDGRHRGRV